jgi:hypothetical protein
MPIPVAVRFMGVGLGRLVVGIAGSNSARDMDVLSLYLYVVLSFATS